MARTHPNEGQGAHPTSGEGKPTVRQVYALAAALCERAGEEWPATRADASELIERLRIENGHPAPRLEDTPLRPRPVRHGRRRGSSPR
ncbi:MAG: hypothetical protein M3321_01850 [Actinomycetota bacterium]|nr:hypothetical protein [Actinomycetota bacterium]